jgi:DNA (cytosine-5)-methyltransferase 1
VKIKHNKSLAAVDLFCGAGGLTKGLELAKIDVKLGIDIDPACQFPFEKNTKAKFLLKRIEEVTPAEIKRAFGHSKLKLLVGCAPCQPFSLYRLGKSDHTDSRWRLLTQFQRLVLAVKPAIVTMENVPRLAEQRVFKRFTSALEQAGFHVWHDVVRCADYGVPQVRERLVLLASRLGPISLIPPTHMPEKYKTVEQAIGNLPRLKANGVDRRDPLHQCAGLSKTNLQRIRASRPGGTWRDWAKTLVAKCHRKASGKTYPSVYGRMSWHEPAPTLTGQFFGFGNGRFGHPEQNRAISLREGAILQSFPRNYRFIERGAPIYRKRIGLLIGNAVPVKLAEAIGRTIRLHVKAARRARKRKPSPKKPNTG